MPSINQSIKKASGCKILKLGEKIKLLREAGQKIVDLSIGTPNFLPENAVYLAAKEALKSDSGCYGSSKGDNKLIEAYQKKIVQKGVECSKENIVIGAGAKHLLFSVLMTILEAGDEVIIPAPCWPSYIDIIESLNARVKLVDCGAETNYKLSPEQLTHIITKKTKVFILNNPSNPSGITYTKDELKGMYDILKNEDIWVISDDVYSQIYLDGIQVSHLSSFGPDIQDKLISIDSISKSYGMPGWRVGMLIGPKEIARSVELLNSNSISNISEVATAAAIAALNSTDCFMNQVRDRFTHKRSIVYSDLVKVKEVNCPHPNGAFYLFPDVSKCFDRFHGCDHITDDVSFVSYLLSKKGVATVPGSYFGSPKSIRISYTASDKNLRVGIQLICEFIRELKSP